MRANVVSRPSPARPRSRGGEGGLALDPVEDGGDAGEVARLDGEDGRREGRAGVGVVERGPGDLEAPGAGEPQGVEVGLEPVVEGAEAAEIVEGVGGGGVAQRPQEGRLPGVLLENVCAFGREHHVVFYRPEPPEIIR